MENDSAFLIHIPEKIISKLSILIKDKCILTAFFGENDDSFITTVLAINKKDNVFICDGCKENLTKQILNSSKIIFKTERLGVKVAFNTIKLAKTQHQGLSAFAVPIPTSILWMEYREFYRVRSPVSKASYCQLTLKGQEPINLKLYDISLAGFSVLNASSEISALMTPDAHFEQCKLILADTGEDTIAFEICSKYILNPGNLNRMEKIGCKFTLITPAFENTIQRYMQQIEKETLKKRTEYSDIGLH